MTDTPRDIPILFSGAMVRANFYNLKTQTRRVLTPGTTTMDAGNWPNFIPREAFRLDEAWLDEGYGKGFPILKVPYVDLSGADRVARVRPRIIPGDRLWVRERFAISGIGWGKKPKDAQGGRVHYHADPDHGWQSYWGNWRPSIHMPRFASRMTCVVTDVRIQRLQDMTEDDAFAEGIEEYEGIVDIVPTPSGPSEVNGIRYGLSDVTEPDELKECPIEAFEHLWDSLNKERGYGWDDNPWVIAISYDLHRCNIDQLPKTEAA